ncbi:hypothetical protein, partial [Vibrio cholerae]
RAAVRVIERLTASWPPFRGLILKPPSKKADFYILHFTESVPHLNEMTCYVVATKQQQEWDILPAASSRKGING